MELGAMICTPKTPACSKCPIRKNCYAKKNEDIEDCIADCKHCLPKSIERNTNPVLDYPRKEKKTKVTEKSSLVFIILHEDTFCLFKRPPTGLLANLYEFPNIDLKDDQTEPKSQQVKDLLKKVLKVLDYDQLKSHGELVYKFSHITQKYHVWSLTSKDVEIENIYESNNFWVPENQLEDMALSTAMKKVFNQYKNGNKKRKRELSHTETNANIKQSSIKQFFTKK